MERALVCARSGRPECRTIAKRTKFGTRISTDGIVPALICIEGHCRRRWGQPKPRSNQRVPRRRDSRFPLKGTSFKGRFTRVDDDRHTAMSIDHQGAETLKAVAISELQNTDVFGSTHNLVDATRVQRWHVNPNNPPPPFFPSAIRSCGCCSISIGADEQLKFTAGAPPLLVARPSAGCAHRS